MLWKIPFTKTLVDWEWSDAVEDSELVEQQMLTSEVKQRFWHLEIELEDKLKEVLGKIVMGIRLLGIKGIRNEELFLDWSSEIGDGRLQECAIQNPNFKNLKPRGRRKTWRKEESYISVIMRDQIY